MDLHVLLHLFIPPCKKNPTFIVFIAILRFLFTTGERKTDGVVSGAELRSYNCQDRLCLGFFPPSVVFYFAIFSSNS